jgi:hypothetical protein
MGQEPRFRRAGFCSPGGEFALWGAESVMILIPWKTESPKNNLEGLNILFEFPMKST